MGSAMPQPVRQKVSRQRLAGPWDSFQLPRCAAACVQARTSCFRENARGGSALAALQTSVAHAAAGPMASAPAGPPNTHILPDKLALATGAAAVNSILRMPR